jgi:hypothetical protein
MSDTDLHMRVYNWFAERAQGVPLTQDVKWYFSPNPNNDETTLFVGIEDGKWIGWRMTPKQWEEMRASGDDVVYRNAPWWRKILRTN